MSLQQIIKENNIKIGLWKIEESLEELLQLAERISIPNCNTDKRKKEFLISRLLLKNIRLEASQASLTVGSLPSLLGRLERLGRLGRLGTLGDPQPYDP